MAIKIRVLIFCFFLFNVLCKSKLLAQDNSKISYEVENIELPIGLNPQTGGIDFLPSGKLVACFMRGEIMLYDPYFKKWSLFASGLQSPLGIMAITDSELLVMQLTELTRIKDTNGDGKADLYEKVTDDFGVSGNYHEFNYGPVKDQSGNLFFALNTASSGGGIRSLVRGEINPLGRDGNDGKKQMFSVVPYRGWVMKVTPEGEVIPFASGLRSPNGIGFDLDGNLFVTDNQSDWVETSALYHIKKDNFYGHPASLVWKEDWENRDPFNTEISELNSMRTVAAVLFPQGIIANSPSEPTVDATRGKFGPFAGQFFIGEMNRDRIVRVMLEEVGGELQGACIPFMDGNGITVGNNRLAFDQEGNLWVGKIKYGGWVGQSGIQKISFTGVTPMDLQMINLSNSGFDLTFTAPLNKTEAKELMNYRVRRYRYEYKKKDIDEGIDVSTQVDVQNVKVTGIKLSEDKKKVSLSLEKMKAGYVYELILDNIKDEMGKPLANNLVCYTLNKLIE